MGKSIVLSGYFGFKNFGDEAILSLLTKKLQTDGHNITIITSDKNYTETQFPNVKTVGTFKLFDILKAIISSEILISGGGSLLQDVTSIKSLIYYLFIIFLGLFFNRKVIIFAQGIGPINNKFAQLLTMQILKKCHYISVRDEKSQKLLNSYNIKSDLVCDPIFSLGSNNPSKTHTVAVQLRNFRTINDDFIDRLAFNINKEFNDKRIEIYSFQDEIDIDICKKFQRAIELLNPEIKTEMIFNMKNSEIIERISKVEYVIAMRFHALILGLLCSAKVLAINYDIKVEKLAKEFKIPIIDLKTPFNNEFQELKNINLEEIQKIVSNTHFDWSGFDAIINKR